MVDPAHGAGNIESGRVAGMRPASATGTARPTSHFHVLRALIELTHPVPVLLTLMSAALFAMAATRGHTSIGTIAFLVAALGLSQIAIATHNDVCDIDLDARSRRCRPLSRGLIPVPVAWGLVVVSAAGALALATLSGPLSTLLMLSGTALGFVYNAVLKRTVWSPAPFALAFPLLPMWIFVVVGRAPASWWTLWAVGLPLALCIHLSDSLPDLEADGSLGAGGLAWSLGSEQASVLCRVALGVAIAVTVLLLPLTVRPVLALIGIAIAAGGLGLAGAWKPDSAVYRHGMALAALALGASWTAAIST